MASRYDRVVAATKKGPRWWVECGMGIAEVRRVRGLGSMPQHGERGQ